MTLGRKNVSVARTNGGADIFRLALGCQIRKQPAVTAMLHGLSPAGQRLKHNHPAVGAAQAVGR